MLDIQLLIDGKDIDGINKALENPSILNDLTINDLNDLLTFAINNENSEIIKKLLMDSRFASHAHADNNNLLLWAIDQEESELIEQLLNISDVKNEALKKSFQSILIQYLRDAVLQPDKSKKIVRLLQNQLQNIIPESEKEKILNEADSETRNYFEMLENIFLENIADVEEDERTYTPTDEFPSNHQDAIKKLRAIKEKITAIKNQTPQGKVTIEKFKAIKKLYQDAQNEPPPTIIDIIPRSIYFNRMIFNVDNLAILTLPEKIQFAKLMLFNDMEALNKLCIEKNLLNYALLKDLNIKSAINLIGDDKTQSLDTLGFVLNIMLSYPQYTFLQDIFKSIPDDMMPERDKMDFIIKYLPQAVPKIYTLAYDESPPPLTMDIKRPVKITPQQYNLALTSPLDYSDFIILTLGLLKCLAEKNMNASLVTQFNNIEKNYFELNYEKCITDLVEMGKIFNIDFLPASLKCHEVDKKNNHSRRFYELRLAQYSLGQFVNSGKLKSFNRLFSFLEMNSVKDLSEVEDALTFITNNVDSYTKEQDEIKFKKMSPKYLSKDRATRTDFVEKEVEKPGERKRIKL